MNRDKEKLHVCCIEESTEEEIQQIVKSLPNTFGGIY
jgi:hypothetical protein